MRFAVFVGATSGSWIRMASSSDWPETTLHQEAGSLWTRHGSRGFECVTSTVCARHLHDVYRISIACDRASCVNLYL
jgi:hypothetical protein